MTRRYYSFLAILALATISLAAHGQMTPQSEQDALHHVAGCIRHLDATGDYAAYADCVADAEAIESSGTATKTYQAPAKVEPLPPNATDADIKEWARKTLADEASREKDNEARIERESIDADEAQQRQNVSDAQQEAYLTCIVYAHTWPDPAKRTATCNALPHSKTYKVAAKPEKCSLLMGCK